MAISQLDLAFASGVIQSLDFDGTIKIKTGPELRINDPNHKYSAGYDELPFFTADDENPSVTSFRGFPMCVPQSATDEKCPSSNRPADVTSFTVPDATHRVPMQVGDYIECSGTQKDVKTICDTMVMNIGLQTADNQPGFVRVEDTIIGISDTNIDVEAARQKFVGTASHNDLPVSIWAIDVDPCTGAETDRLVATTPVEVSARNKWEAWIAKN